MTDFLTYVGVLAAMGLVWFLISAALGYERWQKDRVFEPQWALGLVGAWVLGVLFLSF